MGPSRPCAAYRHAGGEWPEHVQHAGFRQLRHPPVTDFSRAQKGPEVARREQVGIQQVVAHQVRMVALECNRELVGVPGHAPVPQARVLERLKVENDRTEGHCERVRVSVLRRGPRRRKTLLASPRGCFSAVFLDRERRHLGRT